MWWESEERQAVALLSAALQSGAKDLPTLADVWDDFNTSLTAPPVHLSYSRDELALRRALGVA